MSWLHWLCGFSGIWLGNILFIPLYFLIQLINSEIVLSEVRISSLSLHSSHLFSSFFLRIVSNNNSASEYVHSHFTRMIHAAHTLHHTTPHYYTHTYNRFQGESFSIEYIGFCLLYVWNLNADCLRIFRLSGFPSSRPMGWGNSYYVFVTSRDFHQWGNRFRNFVVYVSNDKGNGWFRFCFGNG